ncbi:jg18537 [Pararge aegeria aegeria]|uniref:non-specific serine/threonine protein kinase n=1 Tax=Pararge aegeria aegeria TaxID=348720 RepID=A0A8S4S8W2_9NEOP|nr:jg18537 [Pararge aegeria aegeria]
MNFVLIPAICLNLCIYPAITLDYIITYHELSPPWSNIVLWLSLVSSSSPIRLPTSITVKDFIVNLKSSTNQCDITALDVYADKIGEIIRRMHENNIIHGDLTTSNMLLVEKDPTGSEENSKWLEYSNVDLVLIDFGLSFIDSSAEDKGVDLYVLERALISTHNDYPNLFNRIFNAYKSYSKNNIKEIISKYEDVRARGRKRTMVG